MEAEATDSYGNIISNSSYAWITGGAVEDNNYPSLEIITDKKLYSYGDKAKILILPIQIANFLNPLSSNLLFSA